MATITTLKSAIGSGLQQTVHATRMPLVYQEVTIDLAAAATAKGSALAAADIIQAISVPAQSVVLTAGFEVLTAQTGSTVLTLHLGTTVDNDAFVATFDYFAAAVGAYGVKPLAGSEAVFQTAGTVDLVINTLTTTNTGGTLRVFAWILDALDQRIPGITQPRS